MNNSVWEVILLSVRETLGCDRKLVRSSPLRVKCRRNKTFMNMSILAISKQWRHSSQVYAHVTVNDQHIGMQWNRCVRGKSHDMVWYNLGDESSLVELEAWLSEVRQVGHSIIPELDKQSSRKFQQQRETQQRQRETQVRLRELDTRSRSINLLSMSSMVAIAIVVLNLIIGLFKLLKLL